MGELGALFNPGMRHELEERRARAARREEEGNARDGDLRIDLESGVAVINAPEDDDEAGGKDNSGSGSEVGDPAEPEAGDSPAEPAPAAESKPATPRPRGKRAMSATRR